MVDGTGCRSLGSGAVRSGGCRGTGGSGGGATVSTWRPVGELGGTGWTAPLGVGLARGCCVGAQGDG